MATPIKYKPSQKVNMGVGKDNLNDFARKYNLELDEIFKILNLRSARQVYFRHDSVHWSGSEDDGYTLTIPHNGNAVFGVYSTDYDEGVSTLVSAGVTMDSTNVTIEADAPFDGFMMYAGLNDGAGMGANLSDDVIEALIVATREQFADYMQDAENFAESDVPFYKYDDTEQQVQHNSAKHYAEAAESNYNAILAVNTPEYLNQVISLLQEWTTLVTDGIFELDAAGGLMPKELPSIESELWELDTNEDIEPTEEETAESEGD